MEERIKMKSIYQPLVLTIKFGKISFARCSCLFRYVSLPLCRPLPDQVRLGNRNRNFSTDSTTEYENLLPRADVQQFLQFISEECDKYLNRATCRDEVLTCINEIKDCENHLTNLRSLTTDNDEELEKIVTLEEEQFKNKIKHNYSKLLSLAFPRDVNEDGKGAVIEVTPGVGGSEAKLFAEEVFAMYLKYVDFRGWTIDYLEKSSSEGGGMNKGEVCVSGEYAFTLLKHEAGIHRVQRVPKTEKAGRMQTSTCKVHVLPEVGSNEIELKRSDLKIETKLSSGPGGQNVQKNETCVKITHLPTGLSAESQKERYQKQNMLIALKKLKNLIHEKEQRKQDLKETELKKKQAKTFLRSDKVRTYHFPQNRVTDHRINHTAHNVKLFMEGTALLNELIYLLDADYKRELLLKNIARILKEKNADEIFNKLASES